MKVYTHREWLEEGRRRFGDNIDDWKFICPMCGRKQSINEFRKHGIKYGFAHVYFICISQWVSAGLCGFSCAMKPRIRTEWTIAHTVQQKPHEAEVITKRGRRVPVFLFGDAETPEPIVRRIATNESFFGRPMRRWPQRPIFQSAALTARVVPNLNGGWSIKDGLGTEFGHYGSREEATEIMKLNGW